MGRQWPASVVNALRCLTALVGLMALGTLLTIVFQDALIESWAEGNPGASEILDEGGIEALKASSISLPAFSASMVAMVRKRLSMGEPTPLRVAAPATNV